MYFSGEWKGGGGGGGGGKRNGENTVIRVRFMLVGSLFLEGGGEMVLVVSTYKKGLCRQSTQPLFG